MKKDQSLTLTGFMNDVRRRNRGQKEFQQAVGEWAHDVLPWVVANPDYQGHNLSQRLTEPDRVISFRVCWEDDEGNIRTNRAWRVQFNNSIGPYKGGLQIGRAHV